MSEFKPVGRFIEPGPRYRGVERIAQIRSYSEYGEASVADSKGYWLEGEKVFAQSQVFEMLAAAPTSPQPIYDEAKERELFEAAAANSAEEQGLEADGMLRSDDGEYQNPNIQLAFWGWLACAQSRAKAGEDE